VILFSTNFENNNLNVFNRQILVFHEVAIGNQILYNYKDVGMRNEASPESVRLVIRPVIHPLSIRPVVHADRHLGAPRLPAAHHPSAESDTAAFCPPRMGRK